MGSESSHIPVDEGAVIAAYEEYEKSCDAEQLFKALGIATALATNPEFWPKDKADLLKKMHANYYSDLSAGAEKGQLPVCVGKAAGYISTYGMKFKYGKKVGSRVVTSVMGNVCPDMVKGGVSPLQAIEACNAHADGKGLEIEMEDDQFIYLRLSPTVLSYDAFAQAAPQLQSVLACGLRAIVIVVVEGSVTPLHAMVAIGVEEVEGRPGIRALNLPLPGNSSRPIIEEKVIAEKQFFKLIISDPIALEILPEGKTQELTATESYKEARGGVARARAALPKRLQTAAERATFEKIEQEETYDFLCERWAEYAKNALSQRRLAKDTGCQYSLLRHEILGGRLNSADEFAQSWLRGELADMSAN